MGICPYGIEAALLLRLGRRWQLTAAGAFMQSIYIENPRVTVLSDVDNTAIDTDAESYMGDCRPGGIPQGTACFGAGYFGPKGWGFRLSAGYVGGRYVEPEPVRRTQRIARQAGTTPETFDAFIEQERLKDAFTLDAALFKSFWLGAKSRLTITLMARNLTDDASEYSGYESRRIRRRYAGDNTYREPQPNRYTYVYPRSFYLSVSCRF
ncbi:MAG: TonB-dependent receptor [Alistipes sp.]|nr:TonB-dependent receptor [Alistipes sp.]